MNMYALSFVFVSRLRNTFSLKLKSCFGENNATNIAVNFMEVTLFFVSKGVWSAKVYAKQSKGVCKTRWLLSRTSKMLLAKAL